MQPKPWSSAGIKPPQFEDPPKRTVWQTCLYVILMVVFSVIVSFIFVGITNSGPSADKEFMGISSVLFMLCLFFSGVLENHKS